MRVEEFWSHVEKRPGGCWIWTGRINEFGYGRYGGQLAHRIAWELVNGPIADGLRALHACDTPACVRAESDPLTSHIFLGTQLDNVRDMLTKGRGRKALGAANGHSKLTEAEVQSIRSRFAAGGVTQTALAREFGVSSVLVSLIVRRKNWRHLA